MADHRESRVSQGGEGVPRRTGGYVPKAAPAAPDDWRVEQLLGLCPDYDTRRWVQSMVGWQRLADSFEAERDALRALLTEALDEYADHQSWRCGHPDRYSHDPDCPCGLVAYLRRGREALGDREGDSV